MAIDVGAVVPAGVTPTHYALTSANDCAERDPATWVLEGLPCGADPAAGGAGAPAAGWVPLDTRAGHRFRKRFGVQHFTVRGAASRRWCCLVEVGACMACVAHLLPRT